MTFSAQVDGARGPLPNPATPNDLIAAHWAAVDFADVTHEGQTGLYRIRWVQQLTAGWRRTVNLLIHGDGSFEILWEGNQLSTVTVGHEDVAGARGRTIYDDATAEAGFEGPQAGARLCVAPPLLLDCAGATPVNCGDSLPATLPAMDPTPATTYGCTSTPYRGNELVFRLDLATLQSVDVSIDSPDLDLLLVNDAPCGEPWCTAVADDRLDFSALWPGTYYFVVDKEAAGGGDAFNLQVSCGAPFETLSCGSTTPGVTSGQSVVDSHSCVGPQLDGPEALYRINLATPQSLSAWLDGAAVGQWVVIYDQAGFEAGSTDCLTAGLGGASLTDAPAGDYVIVVDGEAGAAGAFVLELRCASQLDCSGIPQIDCGELVAGDTTGSPSAVGVYACVPGAFPEGEDVYRFVNPVEQAVSIELISGPPGQRVILLNSCDENDCYLGDEGGVGCPFLPAGTYLVVIDGPAGPYELEVVCGAVDAGVDLLVTALDASPLITDCRVLDVTGIVQVQVTNLGRVDAAGPLEVVAYEDSNLSGDYESGLDNLLGSSVLPGGVASGRTVSVDVPATGTLQFRDNAIHAKVDAASAVVESDETNNSFDTGQACIVRPDLDDFQPVVEWSWSSPAVQTAYDNVDTIPLVADMDGDGLPEIIFAASDQGSFGEGWVRCLRGDGSGELWVADDNRARIIGSTNLALGDLDADGLPEIVALSAVDNERLVIIDNDGSFLRYTDALVQHPTFTCARVPIVCAGGGAAIADMDCDGLPEIIYGANVFNADGSPYWILPPGRTLTRGINNGTRSPPLDGALSLVADVDLDGMLEVVAGPTAYKLDPLTGEAIVLWNNPAVRDGFPALGNFDGDDFPEIVITANGRVSLLEGDTGELIWDVEIPRGGGGCSVTSVDGGPPTVAAFDGDCRPEVGVAGADWYAVFETDGTLRWKAPITDCSSHRTASTVFDFDGDGAAEVAFADELWLHVFSGIDGSEIARLPTDSHTWQEMVSIADVDADGSAEIVVPLNPRHRNGHGIQVIGDADGKWVGTRGIWNQHTYHIDNVNDDGTIPGPLTGGCEAPSWLGHGTYRDQLGSTAHPAPDLTLAILDVQIVDDGCDRDVIVDAIVGNGGAVPVGQAAQVSFYSQVAAGPLELRFSTMVADLAPSQSELVQVQFALPRVSNLVVVAIVDDDGSGMRTGSILECREDNNECREMVTDPGPGIDPPLPVGPALRATDHGDPHAADITGDFNWVLDEGLPRPPGGHYHLVRSTDPQALTIIPGTEPYLGLTWTDVTPRSVMLPTVHFLKILATNECEQEEPR